MTGERIGIIGVIPPMFIAHALNMKSHGTITARTRAN